MITDFRMILREPPWLTCSCGARTAGVPCWDCARLATANAERSGRVAASLATIPPRFRWATLEALAAPEYEGRVQIRSASGQLRKSADDFRMIAERVLAARLAVFQGASGTGKSSFAAACLRARAPHGIWMSSVRLATARIQHAAGDGEAAVVEKAMSIPLLLIDDIGGEQKTATNAVRDVIFARHDAELPTWVTTGFSASQIVDFYGDGVLRRLSEGALALPFGNNQSK